jgi:hypothetical protein
MVDLVAWRYAGQVNEELLPCSDTVNDGRVFRVDL